MKILKFLLPLFTINAIAAEITINTNSNWESALDNLNPGDTLILEDGNYQEYLIHDIHGSADNPITIKAQNPHKAKFIGDEDGTANNTALIIEDSSFLVLEAFAIRNFSGVDGTVNNSDSTRAVTHDGVRILDSNNILLKGNLFDEISTRGILVCGDCGSIAGTSTGINSHDIYIKENLFIDVGDDTASSGLAISAGVYDWHVQGNLFATNVDGISKNGTGTSGSITQNLFVFNRFEDSIDVKTHRPLGNEAPNSRIHDNVFYTKKSRFTGIIVQNTAQNVLIANNLFYGSGGNTVPGIVGSSESAIKVRGRGSDKTGETNIPVKNISINGNVLLNRLPYGDPDNPNQNDDGIIIQESSDEVVVDNIRISGNHIFGYSNSSVSVYSLDAEDNSVLISANASDSNIVINTSSQDAAKAFNNNTQITDLRLELYQAYAEVEFDILNNLANWFSDNQLRKALTKGDIPYPTISTPDDSVVILARDAYMFTKNPDNDLGWSTECNTATQSLVGEVVKASGGVDTTNFDKTSKVSYRVQFNDTTKTSYYVYLHVAANSSSAGNAFLKPSGFNTLLDSASDYTRTDFFPTADEFHWVKIGPYTVDPGYLERFTIGGRKTHFKMDAIVFDTTSNLTDTALDQLVNDYMTDNNISYGCSQ